MNKKQGFTLMELLVVVLIIGILAAVALPQYQVAVAKSRYASAMTMVDSVWKAQQVYYMANGTYAGRFEDLDISLPAGFEPVSGNERDDIWESKNFSLILNAPYGPGRYVYAKIHKSGVHIEPQYFRSFSETRAKCYAYAPSKVWNKVCLSLGGKLWVADGFWNIYNL